MFAFGARNLRAKGWEGWNPGNAVEVVDTEGRTVRVHHEVQTVDDDGVVTFSETTSSHGGDVLRVDRGSLRFLSVEQLNGFLAEWGFDVDSQHGGWTSEPLTETSANIVTVARKR